MPCAAASPGAERTAALIPAAVPLRKKSRRLSASFGLRGFRPVSLFLAIFVTPYGIYVVGALIGPKRSKALLREPGGHAVDERLGVVGECVSGRPARMRIWYDLVGDALHQRSFAVRC